MDVSYARTQRSFPGFCDAGKADKATKLHSVLPLIVLTGRRGQNRKALVKPSFDVPANLTTSADTSAPIFRELRSLYYNRLGLTDPSNN